MNRTNWIRIRENGVDKSKFIHWNLHVQLKDLEKKNPQNEKLVEFASGRMFAEINRK